MCVQSIQLLRDYFLSYCLVPVIIRVTAAGTVQCAQPELSLVICWRCQGLWVTPLKSTTNTFTMWFSLHFNKEHEIWMQCCSPVCVFFWINTTRHACCQMLLLDCIIEKIFVEGETYITPAYSLWTLQPDSLETIQHSFHSWLNPNQYWFPSTKMMNPFNTSILRV